MWFKRLSLWFVGLSASAVIVQSNYFGFGCTNQGFLFNFCILLGALLSTHISDVEFYFNVKQKHVPTHFVGATYILPSGKSLFVIKYQ